MWGREYEEEEDECECCFCGIERHFRSLKYNDTMKVSLKLWLLFFEANKKLRCLDYLKGKKRKEKIGDSVALLVG